MQLKILFCVTWVIEFTWTFGDYSDNMIIFFVFFEKIKCMKLSHLSVIMQLCVKWVIEFTWTFGDYFDMMMMLSIFFFENKNA